MTTQLKAPKPDHATNRVKNDDPTAAELLELLGDEYTRSVFEAVAETPRSGRAVAEVADVSRPTAYRRLNELRDAGLVRTEMVICEDGHHREQFEAIAESFSLSLDDGSLDTIVSVSE
jgi:DNA-binding transcriptional ArsR family regulator